MNDLERRVTELFEHDASEAPRVTAPPPRLRRRVRGRQMGTAAVASVTVFAVVLAGFAGIRAIDRRASDRTAAVDPWDGFEIYERTATFGNLTIASPSDLYLVRPAGLECEGRTSCGEAQLLQLTTYDPGLARGACGSPVPADGAAMVISILLRPDASSDVGGLVPGQPLPPVSDGTCGPGRYVRFMDRDTGYGPFVAWVAAGPDADEADERRLTRSLDTLSFTDRTIPVRTPENADSAYVIAGGTNAAGPWRLELRASPNDEPDANVDLSLHTVDGVGPGVRHVTVPEVPIEQAGGDPTFGAVTKEAVGVELRPEGGEPSVRATLVPLPLSMPFDFDLFFAEYEGDVPAVAVPSGPDEVGTPLPPSPEPPSPGPDVVTIEGADPIPWTLELSGSVSDRTACFDLDTKGSNFAPLCPDELPTEQPLVRVWSDSGQLFAVGSAPPGSFDVRFEGVRNGAVMGSLMSGPDGWDGISGFVLPLPSLHDGSIIFSTSAGALSVSLDRATRQIPWSNEGGRITATGEAGSWRVAQLDYREGLRVDLGNQIQKLEQPTLDQPIVLSFPGRAYGALLLVLTDLSVDEVDVASEGRWFGRWMPSSTPDGGEARLWIVELPGAGTGGLSYDGKVVGSVSWP